MTKFDQFLAVIYDMLKKHFSVGSFSEIEEMAIKAFVYDVFERNYDMEMIYYELMDYFEEQDGLRPLAPDVEKHFISLNK